MPKKPHQQGICVFLVMKAVHFPEVRTDHMGSSMAVEDQTEANIAASLAANNRRV